ncbi:hypothetical protein HMPREF1030_05470 [Pseudomonas aeruginosa]|nr:hypothetical protein HMPREF1030_05470 [Pseudomonas aeruginosa]
MPRLPSSLKLRTTDLIEECLRSLPGSGVIYSIQCLQTNPFISCDIKWPSLVIVVFLIRVQTAFMVGPQRTLPQISTQMQG